MQNVLKNTKFVLFLKKLDTTEWKRFRRLLQSPYFNTNQQLLALADALRKFHPNYDKKGCTKPNIFAKIYGKDKSYKEPTFNGLMSQLMKLADTFLIQEALNTEAATQQQLRLKGLKNKHFDNWFFKEIEQQKGALLLQESRDEAFHYSMFLLNQEIFNHPKTTKNKLEIPSLKEGLRHLEQFILWSGLRWEFFNQNRKFVFGKQYESLTLSLIRESNFIKPDTPASLLFYQKIMDYFQTPTDKKLEDFSDFFFAHIHGFSTTENTSFFMAFLNILSFKIRTEKTKYAPISNKVYKIGFSKGVFLVNQILSTSTFLNAISMSGSCGDFAWTKTILEQYSEYLNAAEQKDSIQFGWMLYYFLKGEHSGDMEDYDKVVEIFRDVKTIPVQFAITARSILSRVHYELLEKENWDTAFLENFCANFYKYLHRIDLENFAKKDLFLVFLQNMQKLIGIVNSPEKTEAIKDFQAYLNQHQAIFAHDWFERKIRELR